VTDPDLLLLDEPSEGLAPTIVDDLNEILSDIIDSNVTVMLTEQNLEFALQLADRGYILNKGLVEWGGSIDELREEEELVGKYLSLSLAD
jgi:branched-chain amino acid transport system ATP-binding protein